MSQPSSSASASLESALTTLPTLQIRTPYGTMPNVAKLLLFPRGYVTNTRLNANGHFLVGFYHRIEARYDEALNEFREAITIADSHDNKSDAMSLYSGVPAGVSLHSWLAKLENICHFHSGILQANLGAYGPARESFDKALACDPQDYESLSYIPEIMFLGGTASFSSIVEAFKSAITKVISLPDEQARNFSKPKHVLLSILNLKLGNCYMAESPHADYKSHRDLAQAEEFIQAALTCNPGSLFARLSLAQLLWLAGRNPARQAELFAGIFADARDVITQITEAKILMMYYYILLITSTLGQLPNENPAMYAMRICELVPLLPKPKELRIFSPSTKTDLRVDAFVAEVQTSNATYPELPSAVKSQRYGWMLRLHRLPPPRNQLRRSSSQPATLLPGAPLSPPPLPQQLGSGHHCWSERDDAGSPPTDTADVSTKPPDPGLERRIGLDYVSRSEHFRSVATRRAGTYRGSSGRLGNCGFLREVAVRFATNSGSRRLPQFSGLSREERAERLAADGSLPRGPLGHARLGRTAACPRATLAPNALARVCHRPRCFDAPLPTVARTHASSGGLRLLQRLMLESLHRLIQRSNLCRHRFVLAS